MKATEKLNKTLGKNFLYLGANILIQNYSKKDDKIRVITDKRDYNLTEEELTTFLNDLQPVDNSVAIVPQAAAILNTSGLSDLQNILLDNIKKVQGNKEYIPQASEIQAQVKTFIDLVKVQVDCVKLMQGK